MRWTQSDLNAYELRQRKPSALSKHEGGTEALESSIQEAIRSECNRRGWICNGSRMDLPTTTIIGSPDFWILADKGRLILVECKRPKGGKLSSEQRGYHLWAERLGHKVNVVRSLEEFLAIL